MLNKPIKNEYEKEEEFSKGLQKWLESKKLVYEDSGERKSTPVSTDHDSSEGDKGRPDLIVQQSNQISMKWRELSNPFYIECKLGREYRKINRGYTGKREVLDNLNQYIRYKYDKNSRSHQSLEKYGDYHVAVTCPSFLEEFEPRNFSQEYINTPQLIRTLWYLGIGVFYKDNEGYKIAFNEEEVIIVE